MASSMYRAALSRYLSRHGGCETGAATADPTQDEAAEGEGTVECVFRLSLDDFLELVDLARDEGVLPRTVVQAAFEAYVLQQ